MTTYLIIIVTCLLIEGFFSGSEMGMISSSRALLHYLASKESKRARLVLEIMKTPDKMFSTILIGTNLCTIINTFTMNALVRHRIGEEYSYLTILFITPLILIFGEMLPKTFFRMNANRMVLYVIYPLRLMMWIFHPVIWGAFMVTRLVTRLAGGEADQQHPFVTREELKQLLKKDKGEMVPKEEGRLITRMIDFRTTRAREVMVPLVDVAAVECRAPIEEVIKTMGEKGFSRLPIYQDRVDNIICIVHNMDLFSASMKDPLTRYMRKVNYFPEATRIAKLLNICQKLRREMVVIVDEFGAASGIITVEDILEEVVGEITDEFDRPQAAHIAKISKNIYIADGKARLDDLGETLEKHIDRGNFDTVSGLLMDLAQKVPQVGEIYEYQGIRFRVMVATPRKVKRVKIDIMPEE